MTGDRKRIHVVSSIILSLLGTVAAYEAWHINSWAKWKKSSALGSCLPLPPPLGCADDEYLRDVLTGSETDFSSLSAFSSLISLVTLLSMCAVVIEVNDLHKTVEKLTRQSTLILQATCTGVLNLICCMIATFRIHVVATLNAHQSIFTAAGLNPGYSASYYLTITASVASFIVAVVISKTNFEFVEGRSRVSKTVKQHMARNLMYPDDKRNTKMVTFSSMDKDMEEAAAEICVKGLMKYTLEEDIAEHIKLKFEDRFGPTWHCAVGANFGSAVHHIANEYIEVSMPKLSILLFRCVKPLLSPDHIPLSYVGDLT